MIEYLVFPLPVGLVRVKASSAKAAINKYRRAMLDMSEDELIIVPSSLAKKTCIDIVLPLWKCNVEMVD